MIKIPSFKGFDYTKKPYEELVADTQAVGLPYKLLGKSALGHDIYGYWLGDLNKPTIHLEANIHGAHEWRTCYWMKRFMEILLNPDGLPQREYIEYLKANYSFYFIPSINPDGYINNTYGNGNGVSISANFENGWENASGDPADPYYRGASPFSEPETKIVRDAIIENKPVGLIDTHSWGGYNGMFIRRPETEGIMVSITDMTMSNLLTNERSDTLKTALGFPTTNPSAYQWAQQQTSSVGKLTFAHVLETGTLETEVEQARLGLNGILLFCLYTDAYVNNQLFIF